jgi:7-cyano-7-deazaguanine synthase
MCMATQTQNNKAAIVLLSGGLDSTTALAIAKNQEFDIYAITFQYGQRHSYEIQAAKKIANSYNVKEHIIATIDLARFGSSALTDSKLIVPKHESSDQISKNIPITYVPARNTIFLSFALAWAEVLNISDIFIGVNVLDYSGYPDCRPEYIESYEKMANLATKSGVEGHTKIKIHTPLISLTKAQIISTGMSLGVNYKDTITCYDPNHIGEACGHCDACLLRLKGFKENNIQDPSSYQIQGQ